MDNFRKASLSSLLLVLEQVALKAVGLISTLILARVMVPEDFGVVAIALLVVGLIEILAETGANDYLLRVDNLDDDKINTAWSINLVLKAAISFLMIIGAFAASYYYDDPRLLPVIMAFSAISFIGAFVNPGFAYLRRMQDYNKIIKLSIFTKVCSVIVTVATALILQNYWALVIGKATSTISMVIGSNFVYKYNKKFEFKNAKEQWVFSGWLIPQAIFGYIRTQLDTFLVSSAFGQSAVGSYYTIKYISYIPSDNFLTPLSKPFLVELANAKDNNESFTKQYNASFVLMLSLCLPFVGIMYEKHSLLTLVLLGEQWVDYSFLLQIFSLLLPSYVIVQHASRVLLVYGETKKIFFFQLLSFVSVYLPVLLIGFGELFEFTFVRVALELATTIIFLMYISYKYTSAMNALKLVYSCLVPVISLILSIRGTKEIVPDTGYYFLDLIVYVLFFCFVYLVIYSFLVVTFGKKNDDLQYIKNLLFRFLNR